MTMNSNRNQIGSKIRDNSDRAKTVVGVFVCMIIVNVLAGTNCLMLYSEYHGNIAGRLAEIQSSTQLALLMLFAGLTLVLFVIAIITFLNWFRRAYYNLHQFSKQKLSYDEDMAVWSFMIPFINLIRPHTIAQEIYDVNYDAAKKISADVPSKNNDIISIWWIAYIFLGIIVYILTSIGGEDSIDEIIDSMLYLGIAEFIEIPRLIAAILMVKTVSAIEAIVYRNRMRLNEPEEKIAPLLSEEEE